MKWTTDLWTRAHDTWSSRDEPEYLRALADTYWRALLLAMALIIVCAVLYGTLKFFMVFGERRSGNVLLPRGASLNRVELQATLDGFAAREAKYEFLKKNPPKIPDPSK